MNDPSASSLPRRDAAIAACVAFGFGIVLTAIALAGSDIPLKCVEAGNAADWLAAFGTWVAAAGAWAVGYGANRFAREAHDQRIAQEAGDRAAALEGRRRRLDVLLLRLRKAMVLPAAFSRIGGGTDYDALSKSDVDTIFRVLKRIVCTIEWPAEEVALLHADHQMQLSGIETLLIALDEVVDMGKEARSAGDSDVLRIAVETAMRAVGDISERASSLDAAIRSDLAG